MSDTEFSWSHFLFSFDGRINRKKFWLNYVVAVMLPVTVAGVIIDLSLGYTDTAGPGSLLGLLLLWPGLAVSTKRWHDVGKSGWWVRVWG